MRQCFQREEPRAGTLAAALASILAPSATCEAPERLGSFGGTCHGARQAILQARTSAPPHLRTALGIGNTSVSGSLSRRTGPLQFQNHGLLRQG